MFLVNQMMIAAFGHLTGYNGSFPFSKPGDKYGNTPYVGMRVVTNSFGNRYISLMHFFFN
jgi:dolichyl-phosphate-mannose-protein mannosyltransferase